MLANAVCLTLITHLFNCVINKPVIKGANYWELILTTCCFFNTSVHCCDFKTDLV